MEIKTGFDFEKADEIAEKIHERFFQLITDGHFDDIIGDLDSIMKKASENESLDLSIDFRIYDENRDRDISIYRGGLAFNNESHYEVAGGDALARYISDGNIVTIPNGHCPNCWGDWNFVPSNEGCDDCGFTLGNEVKYLIDDNICPNCLEGKVSIDNPTCDKCGYKVDENIVYWG